METHSKDLHYQSVSQLKDLLDKKEISAAELMQSFIDRTEATENKLGSFLSYKKEDALSQAKLSDKRRAEGKKLGLLEGIPVSLKDNMARAGDPMTCGSKILEKFISPYDAHVTEKLKESGAVLWGRANLDEFAMGSSTENSAFQLTSNPWNTDCVPGGSSGGSASSVAAGQTVLSLGSDTGGSIRQPAALCGIVGMKPTYGLVSRFGLGAFASSLDQIGPFGRSIEDVALLLEVISGHDRRDSTSFKTPIPAYSQEIKKEKGPWKIGVPKEYFGKGLSDEVRTAVEKAIRFYEGMGCEIKEVSLPNMELAIPVYYIIATAEASSNLARYDGVRYTHRSPEATNAIDLFMKSRGEGFGKEVKRRIMLGTYVLSSGYYDAYYLRAQKVRTLIKQDFTKAFESVDALITPTTPHTAFKKGEKVSDPLTLYLEDIYTVSLNLAGLPGLSMPCGLSSNNLPIGLQLIGKPYEEAQLLSIAYAFEQAHTFLNLHPKL